MSLVTLRNNLVIGSFRERKPMNGKNGWAFQIHYDDPDNPLDPVVPGVQATRWTGITDSYINNIEVETLEDGVTTFLNIEALPFRYLDKNVSGAVTSIEELEDEIVKKYESREVFFPMDWFGVKKAEDADVNLKISVKTSALCTKAGEYVYCATGATGPDYENCPYENMPTDPDEVLALIEKRKTVMAYVLTFYLEKSFDEIAEFEGVNPAGKHFSGATSDTKYDPFDYTAAKWKFISQELLEIQMVKKKTYPKLGYEDVAYVKLRRVFERAPYGLLWKTDKNGGEWELADW